MPPASSLIPELEHVLQNGTPERHGDVLRRITALFLQGAQSFNEDHIRLFDDVFGQLIEEIESRARAELSRRLAPIANAPAEVMRRLAADDDIMVAGPVLAQSSRLDDEDLLRIACTKGQAHLFAISGRRNLNESLTDILVTRGDRDVVLKIAENPGARISGQSYSQLVRRAESDFVLAESVAQRADIPAHLFRELLVRATEVVQNRLLAAAKPETQAEIRRVLAKVSEEVELSAERKLAAALEEIEQLVAEGRLDEDTLRGYAQADRYEHTIAALSVLCGVPVEVVDKLMNGDRPDPILILCKANAFSWTTARAIILVRPGTIARTGPTLDQAASNFERLSASTAQRVVRFWQTGNGSASAPLARAG